MKRGQNRERVLILATPRKLAAPRRQAGCEKQRPAVNAVAGLLAGDNVSLPVASSVPPSLGATVDRPATTGRTMTTAGAARKNRFALAQNFGTNARQ